MLLATRRPVYRRAAPVRLCCLLYIYTLPQRAFTRTHAARRAFARRRAAAAGRAQEVSVIRA